MLRQLSFRSTMTRVAAITLVVAFACLMLTVTAFAAPLAQAAPDEVCSSCHIPETAAWEQSPHAMNDVQCETCHGDFVPEHPEEGVMQLTSDPAKCVACHQETADQWQDSEHATHNVACTSCHMSHSQDTRLSREWLCGSCHADHIQDYTHTSHYAAGVTCISCHASQAHAKDAETPSHRFTVINTQACLDCHGKTIHDQPAAVTMPATAEPASLEIAVEAEEENALLEQYEAAKKTNQTLKAVSVINLGVGLGVGALLGILFVLGVFFVTTRGSKAQ